MSSCDSQTRALKARTDSLCVPRVPPSVDILKRQDALLLRANMPGVSEQAVDVEVEKGVLTIFAELEHAESENSDQIALVRNKPVKLVTVAFENIPELTRNRLHGGFTFIRVNVILHRGPGRQAGVGVDEIETVLFAHNGYGRGAGNFTHIGGAIDVLEPFRIGCVNSVHFFFIIELALPDRIDPGIGERVRSQRTAGNDQCEFQ